MDPITEPMPGSRLKDIRRKLHLTVVAFGRALGYAGNENTISTVVRRYEADMRPIPSYISRLAIMFDRHGIPPEFMGAATPKRGPNAGKILTDAEADPEERS